jgi:hypothetical protein
VLDLDAERTLYSSFVSAANSISQLYTQAVQQQRRASAAASRQTLVSCAPWHVCQQLWVPGVPSVNSTLLVHLVCRSVS